MAAQLVKTAILGEDDIDNLDMNTWLTENRLNKMKQYFEENEVILTDLLKYTEDDINVILNDVNITAGAYIKRFKDAVRELQHTHSKTRVSPDSLHQVYRVVTSMKEDGCIKLLAAKLNAVDVALENNINMTSKSMSNCKKIENDINLAFNAYKNKLDERKKLLITKLNEATNKQLKTMKNQKNILEKYKISIQTVQKEHNSLILDPYIDKNKRETQIDQITKVVMNALNDDDMRLPTQPNAFIVDDNAIYKYLLSIGQIAFEPEPPVASVTDINVSSAKIKIDCQANDNITSYNIKYKEKSSDDEKQMDWDTKTIDDDEYILTDLRSNTKYIISAKYQVSIENKNDCWSGYSDLLSFQTLKEQEKWDNNNAKHGVVVNGNSVKWTLSKWGWSTSLGTVEVKTGKHEWKLQINELGDRCYIIFGVVTEDEKKEQCPFKWSNDDNMNFAFGTGDWHLHDFNNSQCMEGFKWESGDKVVMLLDLTNNSMKYTINGKSVTIKNTMYVQDAVYRLVVCNIGVGTEVQLLSYRSLLE